MALHFAALLAVLTAASAAAEEVTLGGCSGMADACPGKQDYRYRCNSGVEMPVLCKVGIVTPDVSWSIDGRMVERQGNGSGTSGWTYVDGYQPIAFRLKYGGGLTGPASITVIIDGTCRVAQHNFTCSTRASNGSAFQVSYSVCLADVKASFQPLPYSSNLLATETIDARPHDIVALYCVSDFLQPILPYIFNITWSRVTASVTKELQLVGQNGNYEVSCFDNGSSVYSSVIRIVADVEDAEYNCTLRKSDPKYPLVFSALSKRFIIKSFQPQPILTYPQIGGVSAGTLILMALVGYIIWRFLTPLQSFLHHYFDRGGLQKREPMSYDAMISFDDESELARKFAFDQLKVKVEDQWRYRLCIPQRDFLPGDDIASKIIEVISNCQRCILLLDDKFFQCRWCECALQNSLKYQGKLICINLMSAEEQKRQKTQLNRIAKVGVVINWKAMEEIEKSDIKRVLLPHYKWTSLNRHMPSRAVV